MPLSFDLWWYATSYALFLLFLPYLSRGLQPLGRKLHGMLAASLLVIWGIVGIIPLIRFNLRKMSVFVFLYWFILISYYKWYMKEFSNKTCFKLIIGGLSFNTLYWLGANLLHKCTGKMLTLQDYPFDHWMISEMAIGFGIFLLFSRKQFYSKTINILAGSAFGVYLIHTYPNMGDLFTSFAPTAKVYSNPWAIVIAFLYILTLFAFCLILDLLCQGLFAITVNRQRGRGFEKFYTFIKHAIRSKYNDAN